MTKTLAITNGLAALQNTVGDRGVCIEGDPLSNEWKGLALSKVFYYMDEKNRREKLELLERNYQWSSNLTWENQANKLLNLYIDPNYSVKQVSNRLYNINYIDHHSEITDNMKKQQIRNTILKTKTIIKENLFPIIQGLNEPLEGCFFSKHLSNEISDYAINRATNLSETLIEEFYNNSKTSSSKHIIEIGFNAGFSTLLMLLTVPDIKVTCVDICEHSYTVPCFNWISKQFPGRVELIRGNSMEVLPHLINENKKYDLIHIDGGHSVDVFFHDIQNSIKLSKNNTIFVVDDYDFCYIKLIWNLFANYHKLTKYKEIKDQSIYRI